MTNAERYREHAAAMRREAKLGSTDGRDNVLRMAAAWEQLATFVEHVPTGISDTAVAPLAEATTMRQVSV
jgi:hypothetical protein